MSTMDNYLRLTLDTDGEGTANVQSVPSCNGGKGLRLRGSRVATFAFERQHVLPEVALAAA
jgi:hypothetical protein